MLRVRTVSAIVMIALSLLTCAGDANAALVKTDLLGGLGEFDFSADTVWQIGAGTWPGGVKAATPDDSVAGGWHRLTGRGVVPEENTIYRIRPGLGIDRSPCQYMALQGTGGTIYIQKIIYIQDALPSQVHHGDRLVFRIDRISMSGYTLPKGAAVQYKMNLICNTAPETVFSTTLSASSRPFAAELRAEVKDNCYAVILQVQITVSGDPGLAKPGIQIDGARLYRMTAGGTAYEMEQVPAPRNRTIRTHMACFRSAVTDPRQIAQDYDAVVLQYEAEYHWALRLKYYNPDIKVSLYELAGGVSDWRDANSVEPYYSNSPFSLTEVAREHPNWLYPWPAGYRPSFDRRQSWLSDACFDFDPDYQNQYFVRMTDPDYQREWCTTVVDKAARYRLDGIMVDGARTLDGTPAMPLGRDPAEVQSFLHAVSPYLRQAGLQAIVDCSTGILQQSPANIYFDPSWMAYDSFDGYEDNTPDNTPDAFFQEWAFFKHWPENGVDMNHYDLGYWNATLANMEAAVSWNRSLLPDYQKTVYILTHGVDRGQDPAMGPNGWVQFALCSYMLAQSEFTLFGADRSGGGDQFLQLDFGSTVRLGTATGSRRVLIADGSLQIRLYSNGFVLVNGHPSMIRTYRLPKRVVDEDNVLILPGKTVTLTPHSGRMFFYM